MDTLRRSLQAQGIGMPVLRCVANKAFNAFHRQSKLFGLTTTQFQQYQVTGDVAFKTEYGIPTSPTRALNISPKSEKNRRAGSNFDSLGSWNNRLDLDIDMEHSLRSGTLIPEINLDQVAIVSLTGRREKNEDRFQVERLTPDLLMFSMYDGHAGAFAADYTRNNMADHIKFWLDRGETDLKAVLHKSFIALNNSLTRLLFNNYTAQDNVLGTGTTALVCLLRNNAELFVGHVGDSKALMCRSGKVVRLTQDHKPTDPKENERILKAGGVITQPSLGRPRVNSKLDMSRSIGDVELKPFGVTCEPDTRFIKLKHGKDAFLVLSTDGVNYVINDQEVIDIVCRCEDSQEAARMLTDQAMHFGTEDNATAMIVPFGAWGKYANTAQTVPFSFGRNIISKRG